MFAPKRMRLHTLYTVYNKFECPISTSYFAVYRRLNPFENSRILVVEVASAEA